MHSGPAGLTESGWLRDLLAAGGPAPQRGEPCVDSVETHSFVPRLSEVSSVLKKKMCLTVQLFKWNEASLKIGPHLHKMKLSLRFTTRKLK